MSLLSAEAALLHSLYDGPAYGLGLIERVRRRSAGRVRLGPGNAYPTLARLVRRRLVRSWRVGRGPGRPRQYFELTGSGIRHVLAERRLLASLLGPEPVLPKTARERVAMAQRVEDCAELSELAASLREQVLRRTQR